ncbi:hypothetical protein ZEAMMB73_Zm00001d000188 [Zea mays]|nr:hypothetical protein ZEAMMB73_Zm00001d000188 [Zea mays]
MPKVAQVLARFKAMPDQDQCKKMMDMEGFLNQRIDKLKEQRTRRSTNLQLQLPQLTGIEGVNTSSEQVYHRAVFEIMLRLNSNN